MGRPASHRSRAARLTGAALAGIAVYRYLTWCRRFADHEQRRRERPPGFAGGVTATS
jgi:hypothetical protein